MNALDRDLTVTLPPVTIGGVTTQATLRVRADRVRRLQNLAANIARAGRKAGKYADGAVELVGRVVDPARSEFNGST